MGMEKGSQTRIDPWICAQTTTGLNPCRKVGKTKKTNTVASVGIGRSDTILTPSHVNRAKLSSDAMPLKDW